VIIADDESIIRMDLREMLTNLGYLVVGEVGDGRSAVNLARELRPDIVIMDIKFEGDEFDGIDAAKQLADASRRQIGNYRFDILLQANRSNHLTIVEIWKNLAAVETHEMAVSTKSFREQILPMSGALYDQRLYRELN
jgi:DNA-binding NarL/FixJ family response regulator